MKSIPKEVLQTAATKGETDAAEALSVLSKKNITVQTRQIKSIPASGIDGLIGEIKEHSIIAYTQAITGVSGMSLLSVDRKNALILSDIFNGRPVGATIVMQELDRSTIKEAINILANAYINNLANQTKTSIILNVPKLITKSQADNMIADVTTKIGEEMGVLFSTTLTVQESNFDVDLYFFFVLG